MGARNSSDSRSRFAGHAANSKRSPAGGRGLRRSRSPARTETVRVTELAAGGDGAARLASGEVVFVERAAPGDLVEIGLEPASRGVARARVLRVVEPGPDRVEPPCPHVEACGGCAWMHLAIAGQERAHAAIVRGALERALGPGAAVPEVRVHPAPASLGYRTRARLFVRAERGIVRVGYRAAGAHALAAVDSCMVLDPRLAPVLAELPVALAGARGEGDAAIALGAGERPVVEIEWKGEIAATSFAAADALVARGAWAGARIRLEGAALPASFGDPRARMEGPDGAPLVIAEGSFAQTSSAGSALLARRVAELARARGGAAAARPLRIVELFAGSGTLSVALAPGAEAFTAVEIAPDAVKAARENLAARGLAGKVVCADADAFAIPARTDVVVLDPPRAGAPGAARAIAASSVRSVVYVSCDPPTLARDARTLSAAGYSITDVEAFELFPQTSHVEVALRLAKDPRSRVE